MPPPLDVSIASNIDTTSSISGRLSGFASQHLFITFARELGQHRADVTSEKLRSGYGMSQQYISHRHIPKLSHVTKSSGFASHVMRIGSFDPSYSKIGYFQGSCLVQKHIFSFNISVDNLLGVEIAQPIKQNQREVELRKSAKFHCLSSQLSTQMVSQTQLKQLKEIKIGILNRELHPYLSSVLKYTCDILAIINATVDGAKSTTSNDGFDNEFGGINLPFLPTWCCCRPSSSMLVFFLFLALLHSPCSAQMPLKLLVQALQIYLIRSHIPTTFTLLLHLSRSPLLCLSQNLRKDLYIYISVKEAYP
ncbi:Paired amphipathic helix protein Sin3-like 4 [Senna tora]|uniref:Paired amphipathic helix protein Sin3-like 4 n=1 Tax=Senna tora TaxID=362788 RepID=A0A834TLB6_9FABA|nr:Paired amphipathic helix protein Sin3-like 4 [Senna tora]